MATEDNPAARSWPPLNATLEWASYACVVPLVAGVAAVGLLPEYAGRELAQRAVIAWGGALLAFTGAVHWGLALGTRAWPARSVAAALAALVCAAAAVTLGGQRGLALLVVGYGLLWLYEHRVLGDRLPPGYLNLRRQLSVASCVLLAITMFVSDAHGIS